MKLEQLLITMLGIIVWLFAAIFTYAFTNNLIFSILLPMIFIIPFTLDFFIKKDNDKHE